jgi:DNA-binding MarR family transcriptional regulator
MNSKGSRARVTNEIRDRLREMRSRLTQVSRQVGRLVDVKDSDLECLDQLHRDGPLSPTALARRLGLHPATMTGIVDRLERQGWVSRQRDPADRRGIVIQAERDRSPDLLRHYAGMNAEITRICSGYDTDQLELIAGFLRQMNEAGQRAAENLAGSGDAP